jgi:hypothetical protein
MASPLSPSPAVWRSSCIGCGWMAQSSTVTSQEAETSFVAAPAHSILVRVRSSTVLATSAGVATDRLGEFERRPRRREGACLGARLARADACGPASGQAPSPIAVRALRSGKSRGGPREKGRRGSGCSSRPGSRRDVFWIFKADCSVDGPNAFERTEPYGEKESSPQTFNWTDSFTFFRRALGMRWP